MGSDTVSTGVVDALLTDGILDFGHISILPLKGWATDECRAKRQSQRVRYRGLPKEVQRERLQQYSVAMANRPRGQAKPAARVTGVAPGPISDALRDTGPRGWHCPHGAHPLPSCTDIAQAHTHGVEAHPHSHW